MDLMNHALKSVNALFITNKLSLNTTKINYIYLERIVKIIR